MALINVGESDEEIIPSSSSFTFIGKQNELKLLKDYNSVHSSGKEERIVAAHTYLNNSPRSKKRMKKKSFNFINEFSQNLSQSQETEIFWSLPTLANYTPTKDNKKNKNNSSSGTHSFEEESSPPANNSDSCKFVNNNKKHSFNADVNNSSSRFLSLSPLKKARKMRINDRKLYTEAGAGNLGNEVSESPSEVLFKKRKPNSIISSRKEHSGEFQSPEILSQNEILEIENKNLCILNNVNAESTPPFSCDLFDSNLVTAPITEELHTVKGKLSPFKEKKEIKRKEIMVNNVEALTSHQINSKEGQTLQIFTDEISGLFNHPNSKTIIERESDSKKLEDKKSNYARFSSEKCSEYDNPTKKQQKEKLKDVASNEVHSSPEKVNGFDNSPKKLRNKKVDDVSDGYTSPEKVNGWDCSLEKLRNKKVDDVSDRYTSLEKVNGSDNSPKKLRNKKVDDVSDAYTSPGKVSGWDNSPKKLRKKKVGDDHFSPKKSGYDDISTSEKVIGYDGSPKKLQNKKEKDETSSDDHSSVEKVNGCDRSPNKALNKKQYNSTSEEGLTSPETVAGDDKPMKKQRKNKLGVVIVNDDHLNPEIIHHSRLEKRDEDYNGVKKQCWVNLKDEGSKEDNSSVGSDNENPIKNLRNPKMMSTSSTGYHCRPKIVSEAECSTEKQRHSKLVNKTLTDDHSSPDKVAETDHALRVQRNIRSKNKSSIDQYSRPEIVSESVYRTKKQRNNVVEITSTDLHSSLDKKVNGNINTTKKQRRRSGKPLERTTNDDQMSGTDGESEVNDFRLILLKEDIPLTDKEIYYLHRKLAKAYTLSEDLCNKLRNLDIKITWKLSEIHRDYNFIHNGEFSYADKSDLRHTKLKEGAFEPEENEAIMNRWTTFCKLYNFNASKDFRGFLPKSYDHKKPNPLPKYEKFKFVLFLGKDLPDRLLHTVYARFVELLKYYKKGRFSTEEDEWLLIFKKYSRNRRIYSILSSLLHRSRFTIYKRMKILSNFYGDLEAFSFGDIFSNNSHENNIDPQEENELSVSPYSSSRCDDNETLRKTIAHLTGSEDIQKWDSFTAKKSCWDRIGKKCKIPPVEAKLQYLCNLRIKSLPHKIPQTSCLQIRIIHRLKKYRWKKWNSINWNLLSEELFDLGPVFLYVTFRRYVKNSVPSEFWGKLTDCLNYIEQNKINLQNEDISD